MPNSILICDARALQTALSTTDAGLAPLVIAAGEDGFQKIEALDWSALASKTVHIATAQSAGSFWLGNRELSLSTKSALANQVAGIPSLSKFLLEGGQLVVRGDGGLIVELSAADLMRQDTTRVEQGVMDIALVAITSPGQLIKGTSLGESLQGGNGDDTIEGLGGNDTIDGQAGSDSILGGDGHDVVEGNFGNDTLKGGLGDDTLCDDQGSNWLDGEVGNDSLSTQSLSGQHTLMGGVGNDSLFAVGKQVSLQGGDNDDNLRARGYLDNNRGDVEDGRATLDGGSGNDSLGFTADIWKKNTHAATLLGGLGNDSLSQQGGAQAELSGGDGDDDVSAYYVTTATLSGGAGRDTLTLSFYNPSTLGAQEKFKSSYVLDGGADNDVLDVSGQAYQYYGSVVMTLDGGTGDDTLNVSDTQAGDTGNSGQVNGIAQASLVGGEGRDTLTVGGVLGAYLTGGAGVDRFVLTAQQYRTILEGVRDIRTEDGNTTQVSADPVTVTDFVAGVGGDVFDYSDMLRNAAVGYDGSNPFATGYLRLEQVGSDTSVEFDADGSAGESQGWVTVAMLKNTTASALASANFNPNFDPGDGSNRAPVFSALPTLNFTDTAGNDTFAVANGTLSATDADSDSLSFGVEGASVASGVATKVGTYGTLKVTQATGAYSYSPNDALIEALSSNARDNFTITVGDGVATATGDLAVAITATNDLPTGAVKVSGDNKQGAALTASHTLADVEGLGAVTYQWLSNNAAIAGATGNSFTLTQAQVGQVVQVEASYTDGAGNATKILSPAGNAVANVNDLPTGTVTISGSTTVGKTLTASHTLTDLDGLGAVTYQWRANGTALTGATDSTLVLSDAHVGKTISVLASYTDGLGAKEAVASSSITIAGGIKAVLFVGDESSVYQMATGSVAIAQAGWDVGDVPDSMITLMGSMSAWALPKGAAVAALAVLPTGRFELYLKTTTSSKVSYSSSLVAADGKVANPTTLTIAQLLARETTYDMDIDGDGYVGDRVGDVLQDNGSSGLYLLTSGGLVLAETGLVEGDVPSDARVLVSGKLAWALPKNAVVVGLGLTASGKDDVVTQAVIGNKVSYSSYLVGVDGQVARAVTLSYAQLLDREMLYQQDMDGDGNLGDLVASALFDSGLFGIYRMASGSAMLAEGGLLAGDNPTQGVMLMTGKMPWSLAKGAEVVGLGETTTGKFDVITRSVVGAKVIYQSSLAGTDGQVGKATLLTQAQVLSKEVLYEQDIDGDGYIGDTVKSVLFDDGAQGIYQMASGGFAVAESNLVEGDVPGYAAALTTGKTPWVLSAGMQALTATVSNDGNSLSLLLKTTKGTTISVSEQSFNALTGVSVGRAVTFSKANELAAAELKYQFDLTEDYMGYIPDVNASYVWDSGDRVYALYKSAKTWVEADKYAKSRGGSLLTLEELSENESVYNVLVEEISQGEYGKTAAVDGGGAAYVWLGASDDKASKLVGADEGLWVWADGSQIDPDQANWGGAEPDNYNNQDYLALGLQDWPVGSGELGLAGQWNDLAGANRLYFVVEFVIG